MVDEGGQKGVIDVEEQEMINNVFEFDDLTADEFATHRTDISLLWLDETMDEWANTIHESRHSKYPVCDETVDKVVGVLDVKDFFRFMNEPKEEILKRAIKLSLIHISLFCTFYHLLFYYKALMKSFFIGFANGIVITAAVIICTRFPGILAAGATQFP